MTSLDERAALERFEERYAVPSSELDRRIEQRVLGSAWGANGYTTLDQADELARLLRLRPGLRVLDLGTGRGWPGVYVAVRHGCDVVGTDMPVDALRAARARAAAEGAGRRFAAVVAGGERQPFRPASFDAVVHTDVLC